MHSDLTGMPGTAESLRQERLGSDGPKRILALDGGGIRGAMAIGYLERIEHVLRRRLEDPQLRLRDYYDLIGGSSTGSIIAAGLAIGMSAAEVADCYSELGPRVFSRKRSMSGRLRAVFDGDALVDVLAEHLGERTLGDDSITTGLCIVTKRADTRSTWPLHNHPGGRFFEANRSIPLTTAVRASAAAPIFFTPVGIDVGAGGGRGAFIDGSISMANNPALLLFLLATLKGFPFRWTTGVDHLLITSVGTGRWSKATSPERVLSHRLWNWAIEVPTMLMEDASEQADLLLRYVGWTPTPEVLDLEIGDLEDDYLGSGPMLTYQRYSGALDEEGLGAVGRSELIPKLDSLRQVAVGANVDDLLEIGRALAERDVDDAHFPTSFDLQR
jgi:hypothetical protein